MLNIKENQLYRVVGKAWFLLGVRNDLGQLEVHSGVNPDTLKNNPILIGQTLQYRDEGQLLLVH